MALAKSSAVVRPVKAKGTAWAEIMNKGGPAEGLRERASGGGRQRGWPARPRWPCKCSLTIAPPPPASASLGH